MQPNFTESPYTDPYVRWCGRGGAARLSPIPIKGFSKQQDVDGRDKPGHDDVAAHSTSRGCVCASSGQIGRLTRFHGSLR
jgi:hypothetical protein